MYWSSRVVLHGDIVSLLFYRAPERCQGNFVRAIVVMSFVGSGGEMWTVLRELSVFRDSVAVGCSCRE